METDTAPPRRYDALLLGGMRAARSTSMRFTEPRGHTKEQPAPPRRSTRSTVPPPYTPTYSSYGFIILSAEEEERLYNLEKRLVPNVEFDDQALYTLGFGTDIYYMLGHLRWVQFSNGVSVDTHLSYGPPWAHYLGGYQDRLLSGPLGLPGLRCTAPEGVEHKDYAGVVLG
jgi:hypothetical protein